MSRVKQLARVVPELGDFGVIDHAPDSGSMVRIEARGARAFLQVGGGRWVESVCPTEEGEYVWTRKRTAVPVECDVRIGDDRRWRVEALGVEDESAGYHPRHTVWSWSAGVGSTRDGRSVGWNLANNSIAQLVVTGHNLVADRRYVEACESFRQATRKALNLMP